MNKSEDDEVVVSDDKQIDEGETHQQQNKRRWAASC